MHEFAWAAAEKCDCGKQVQTHLRKLKRGQPILITHILRRLLLDEKAYDLFGGAGVRMERLVASAVTVCYFIGSCSWVYHRHRCDWYPPLSAAASSRTSSSSPASQARRRAQI